jgi:glycine/D-amino acid oxidase-like deaminating enzyme
MSKKRTTLNESNQNKITKTSFPIWYKSLLNFPSLKEDKTTDCVIIGAGITGITTAYLLAKAGKKVIVLDGGPVGGGETGRTTAHLTSVLDYNYSELAEMHDNRTAFYVAQSHTAAINFIEKIIHENKIHCDFKRVDGYLFLHPTDKRETLEKEIKFLKHIKFKAELLEKSPVDFYDGPCIKYPNQAKFHPIKYLSTLARMAIKEGVSIYNNSSVIDIKENYIKIDNGSIVKAKNVIIATHSVMLLQTIFLKQVPYISYVIAGTLKKKSPNDLYWDTGDQNLSYNSYHYVRSGPNNTLIVGGEDHKVEQVNDFLQYKRLEEWTKQRFPSFKVSYQWSGQVFDPRYGLAFIGKDSSSGIYFATGFSGNGMTYGTISAIIISDMILGKKNPWQQIYNPFRTAILKKQFLQK